MDGARALKAVLFVSLAVNAGFAAAWWLWAEAPEVARLRDEVAALRTGTSDRRGEGTEDVAERGPVLAETSARLAPGSSEATPPGAKRAIRYAEGVAEQVKKWLVAANSLGDPSRRTRAVREIQEALDSSDPSMVLAALRAARDLPDFDFDRDALRARVLPHASSDDPEMRYAARTALVWVKPEASDFSLLVEESLTANREHAEDLAETLVRLSGGDLRGDAADAVLHLLRDGRDIRRAQVMRGLQRATTFDPRVQARLAEIVRGVAPSDPDAGYFVVFLAPRLVSQSDAAIDAVLERATAIHPLSSEETLKILAQPLPDGRREHAARGLMDLAERFEHEGDRVAALRVLVEHAGPAEAPRLEALAKRPGLEGVSRGLIREALAVAGRR